jgi:hypothetical protein
MHICRYMHAQYRGKREEGSKVSASKENFYFYFFGQKIQTREYERGTTERCRFSLRLNRIRRCRRESQFGSSGIIRPEYVFGLELDLDLDLGRYF